MELRQVGEHVVRRPHGAQIWIEGNVPVGLTVESSAMAVFAGPVVSLFVGTVQEYRRIWQPIGKPSARNGSRPMKELGYWGLVAIIGPRADKIASSYVAWAPARFTFWSVMRGSKILSHGRQRLAPENLEVD
jgi:hypothetical protein